MAQVHSLSSLTLDLPPSCIAFCPSKPQYFVVGTYLLHPKEQTGAGANNAETPAAQPDATLSSSNQQEDGSESQEGKQLRTGSLILFRLDEDSATM